MLRQATARRPIGDLLDVVLALLLGASTIAYLAALPRAEVGLDEATYLKEALRLLRGEVLYRDVFDLTTPGWMYLMALLFKIFGATFGTARVTAAVIQAATALAVFATCRTVGVRREIALALVVLCVLSAQVNYPVASQHWLVTLLSSMMLLTYLRRGHTRGGIFATGVIIGVLISVHQQRGLSLALGAAMFVATDVLLERRSDRPFVRTLVQRGFTLAAGALAIVGPMLAFIVWQAGFQPVWRGLVVFPLVDYRQAARCPWGYEWAPYYLPAEILKRLPVVFLLSALQIAVLWRRHAPQRRTLLILVVHCGASVLSIWYYPDRIHIALIVPSFAVLAGTFVEWALIGFRVPGVGAETPISADRATPALISKTVGYALAVVLIAPTLVLAREHFDERWRRLGFPYYGPFGRIDFPDAQSVKLHTRIDQLLRDVPDRTLFCHMLTAYTCLFVDGHNPTRFELVVNHYNSPAQIAEVTHMLTIKDVPYIIALPAEVRKDQPMAAFIRRNYDQIERDGVMRSIWRRKAAPNQSVD